MRRDDIPETSEGGLSTEDLAEPSRRDADAAPETREETPTVPDYGAGQTTEAESPGAELREEDKPPEEESPRLLTPEDEESFRSRWQDIQARFVDDPRDSVHAADALVAEVIQRLAATFSQHKKDLEGQWTQGEEVNTEDLRMALRHYRSFFNRLLTVP
ncbi:hypothetical protein LRS74_01340 [Streptomyces sp. LX-29]|uniref:hypothetical protein n=1 Tax=Streptomyces sp. LX-29 TaxID=2900152 RepID=UPI00240D3879|nr:hypothetical protein [Streptomyces sp. LX-29]WFB05813.1 hypothetical protein LRS74_01340 [Streptomyces sp. LX-29]